MFDKIAAAFKTLPDIFWITLAGFVGISTITTPIALVYFLTHSQGFNYVRGDTEIKVLGRNAARNTQQTNQQLRNKLDKLEAEIAELKRASPRQQRRIIKDVEQTFEELKPTAQTAIENSEDLSEIVEKAVD